MTNRGVILMMIVGHKPFLDTGYTMHYNSSILLSFFFFILPKFCHDLAVLWALHPCCLALNNTIAGFRSCHLHHIDATMSSISMKQSSRLCKRYCLHIQPLTFQAQWQRMDKACNGGHDCQRGHVLHS